MQYYSGRVVKPDQTKLGSTKPNKQKTRQCYAGAFDIDSNDFVQMMVIDGCFVLELLRLYNRCFENHKASVSQDKTIFECSNSTLQPLLRTGNCSTLSRTRKEL
ncbi:hypothetical protein CK203_114525 [Vitis vinifera]|uniref:Uncharacterized protein n=1 Tax=Vitis vinifera TaxID=29760 RepID=A0A438EQW0_VITVI|nr:hypothetical protein CK203_114525 [Vitis vinifera]